MTRLTSPYDDLPTEDRLRIQASVGAEDYILAFRKMFPLRAAQDRILGTLFHRFVRACERHEVPAHYRLDNEITAQQILDNAQI